MRYAQTMAFTTLMMFQLFNVFNARSDERSAFDGLFTNNWLWAAVGLSLLLHVAVIYMPVSAAGVFDRGLERGRLAALRGGRKFGAVAARVGQGHDARERHVGPASRPPDGRYGLEMSPVRA